MSKAIQDYAILPINDARITAGYLNAAYRRQFGFAHYGTDLVSRSGNTTLYAPFPMKILAAGRDRTMGNTIVAESIHPVDIHAGKFKGKRKLIVRMAHLASIAVRVGEIVTPEQKAIGRYGNTSGLMPMAAHLHIEFDIDTKYPFHSPTLASVKKPSIWKAGQRGTKLSTVNPMDVLKVDLKGKHGGKQSFFVNASAVPYTDALQDRITLDLDGKVKRVTLL